jgi:pectate lyase
MRRLLLSSALLAGALVIAARADALPVIPGAAGFGIQTPAGRGGAVYKVTNLNETGTGSLKACIDATGPRVCVFEISGTIKLTADLKVRNDYLTIAGQTAPSPGIMLRGGALLIAASNVLVQHIRIRVGDDATGPSYDNRDALKITGVATKPVNNVVIDHCSLSWAMDETLSVWGPNDNITISNNIISEALNDSKHPNYDGVGTIPHGYGLLVGKSPGNSVTIVGNLFAHTVERNPLSRASEMVLVNNLVYDRGHMDVQIQSEEAAPTRNTVLKNVFLRGPSYSRDTSPIYIITGSATLSLGAGSRVYQSGNVSENYPRELVTLTAGDTIPGLLAVDTYPVWNSGLTMVQTYNNGVYDKVLANAGARPVDRDVVDKRVINQVKNRNGQIINCVSADGSARCAKNAGGWPTMAVNRRALTLPANPNTVTASGYTNLEIWLQKLDSGMGGNVQAQSPAAPTKLTAN